MVRKHISNTSIVFEIRWILFNIHYSWIRTFFFSIHGQLCCLVAEPYECYGIKRNANCTLGTHISRAIVTIIKNRVSVMLDYGMAVWVGIYHDQPLCAPIYREYESRNGILRNRYLHAPVYLKKKKIKSA